MTKSRELTVPCFFVVKTTTYTVLRRLCQKVIFRNENGTVVSSVMSKDEFNALKSEIGDIDGENENREKPIGCDPVGF